MATLTSDQKAIISNNSTFLDRIEQILREKALYWKESATADRASVNKRMQKRKRFSRSILYTGNIVDTYRQLIADYWLTTYSNDPAVLDEAGVPTSSEISNTFDPTYDYWAGVQTGDDTDLEIEW